MIFCEKQKIFFDVPRTSEQRAQLSHRRPIPHTMRHQMGAMHTILRIMRPEPRIRLR